MSKINYLIIVPILFFSCQNQERESLISKSKVLREKNGLNSIDKKLKLDSTVYAKLDENDWEIIKDVATYEALKFDKNEKTSNFCIIDFYSNINKNQFKRIYYSDNKGVLKLKSEEDRFYKKINDTIEIYLSHYYNYQKNETIYSIDSLPTKFFVEKNQKRLEQMFKDAEKDNMEICGTAAAEILKEGFPKRYSEINYSKFKKVKTELNK